METASKYLISYRYISYSRVIYGSDITDDPIEWIANIQIYDGTYILLNAQPITDEQYKKYNGKFKGM